MYKGGRLSVGSRKDPMTPVTAAYLDMSDGLWRDMRPGGRGLPRRPLSPRSRPHRPIQMGTLALLLLAACASANTGVYQLPLDPENRHKMYWTLDYHVRRIQIEIHANISPGQWFAVGFSDRGERNDADWCVFVVDRTGWARLIDGWTDDKCLFNIDTSQDCEGLRYSQVSPNFTRFSFSRKFDTCKPHAYVIEDGTTHIVWATESGRLGGRSLCTIEGGMTRTQLLKPHSSGPRSGEQAWHLMVTADKISVPSTDTTYWCKVVKLPERLKHKHHIIQFEAVITKGNEGLVHHMELFHCEAPPDVEIPFYRGRCERKPKQVEVCKKVMAAWAMGATPFNYPQEAGLPVGGEDFGTYAMLEVHYNNPEMRADWVDDSGLKVYLTSHLRPNDAAVMELGLEYTDKMAIPPKQPAFTLTGFCLPQCTAASLPEKGIMVFASQLHTHLTGIRVETRHYRKGVELPLLNGDKHYSTHFQEIRLLPQQIHLLPGDWLETTCWYDTSGRDNVTLGGFAISEEMCVNYIYYFPSTELEVCKSSIADQALGDYFDTLNRFEEQKTGAELPISESYSNIEWNPMRSEILGKLYVEAPISMQCNKSSGQRFPGDWASLHRPTITSLLPKKKRNCTEEKTQNKENDLY